MSLLPAMLLLGGAALAAARRAASARQPRRVPVRVREGDGRQGDGAG